jgi:hypothetical protein
MHIPFVFPGLETVRCVFSTRRGGMSSGRFESANLSATVGDDPECVERNRMLLQRELGTARWLELDQVHGTSMVFDAPGGDDSVRPEADAIATHAPDTALVIKTADCQPVLAAHRSGGHVAALHVGWRGNRSRAPVHWIRSFCSRYGLQPRDVLVARGPSLGPDRSEFKHFQSEWGETFQPYFDATRNTVDLWRLTRDQLLEAGVREDNIFGLDLCTYRLPELFFSYRRDGVCGRQAGIVWITRSPRTSGGSTPRPG